MQRQLRSNTPPVERSGWKKQDDVSSNATFSVSKAGIGLRSSPRFGSSFPSYAPSRRGFSLQQSPKTPLSSRSKRSLRASISTTPVVPFFLGCSRSPNGSVERCVSERGGEKKIPTSRSKRSALKMNLPKATPHATKSCSRYFRRWESSRRPTVSHFENSFSTMTRSPTRTPANESNVRSSACALW